MKPLQLACGIAIVLISCVEPYEPDFKEETFDILVVDGYINTTENSATVRLSRAVPLDSELPPSQEVNATVNIEDEAGNTYLLNNSGLGVYFADHLGIDHSKKYRVHIYSRADEEFISDYVALTNSPPIDSVVWKPDGDGISVYVNTHDPADQSHYYNWTFDETWEYNSSYFSGYKLVDREPVLRYPEDYIYTCWLSETSTRILLSSTDRLAENVVRDFPLTYLAAESSKLARRYSINVHQRTLTKDEYEFRLELEKTTESLGGLFDPMPSQVVGNVRSKNDTSSPVLGYFGGGSISTQRIFIDFVDMPQYVQTVYRPRHCTDEDVTFVPIEEVPSIPNSILLIDPVYVQGVGIVGYTTALANCVDCRTFGGTNKQPDFW
ncbi:MAG TPA: DUF4249 domain-containing protein [Chryseolinea sp.]|nr:DUF4249 domain-containing protein [Chryseolinea sp.]